MNIQEILNELEINRGYFPKVALLAAIEKKEEIIPELLNILKNLNQNYEEIYDHDDDGSYFAHMFLPCIFLLSLE